MWHSPQGDKTFTGHHALVLAHGLDCIIEHLLYCAEFGDEDHDFGDTRIFADLTLEQKAWSICNIAFALLHRESPPPPLHAYVEATVETILEGVSILVEGEIDFLRQPITRSPEEIKEETAVCRAVLSLHATSCRHRTSSSENGVRPMTIRCDNLDRWKSALDILKHDILVDRDFDTSDFVDLPPEQASVIKTALGLSDDYYLAIADDPQPKEARRLLKKAERLCHHIIGCADYRL